jgi:hypothetical protein
MSSKVPLDPTALIAVSRDFVWAVCEVSHACFEPHEHDDHCAGEFPYPSPSVFDSMYGVVGHIGAEVGLDNVVWRVSSPHMWEADFLKDGQVHSRFFINYIPVSRKRPEGFLLSEAQHRTGHYGR